MSFLSSERLTVALLLIGVLMLAVIAVLSYYSVTRTYEPIKMDEQVILFPGMEEYRKNDQVQVIQDYCNDADSTLLSNFGGVFVSNQSTKQVPLASKPVIFEPGCHKLTFELTISPELTATNGVGNEVFWRVVAVGLVLGDSSSFQGLRYESPPFRVAP